MKFYSFVWFMIGVVITYMLYDYKASFSKTTSGTGLVRVGEMVKVCGKHSPPKGKEYKDGGFNVMVGERAGMYVTVEQESIYLGTDGIFMLCGDGTLFIRGLEVLRDQEVQQEVFRSIQRLITTLQHPPEDRVEYDCVKDGKKFPAMIGDGAKLSPSLGKCTVRKDKIK